MTRLSPMKTTVFEVAALEAMTPTVLDRLKSLAGSVVLPIVLLALLIALGRGLDGIIHESEPATSNQPRHINASPAAFGTQRALADRAAELSDNESD